MSVMVNVDNFESFIKLMIDGGNGDVNCGISFEQAGAIITRLRQAEKDAARYRWLRDSAPDMDVASPLVIMADECGCAIDGDDDFCGILFREALDYAIDEAMNGSNN